MKEVEDKVKRIKGMYNACAKNFNQYLLDHDMMAYNVRSAEINAKYGREEDILDLLLWFAPKVQGIHDEWRMKDGDHT